MQEPSRTWVGMASLHRLTVAGSRRQMQADLAVYVSRMLILALGLMLSAWITFDNRAEASDSTPVTGIDLSADTPGEYRLAPGDHLKILVFDQEQLSGDFTVDGTGGILLPVVGQVSVAGLTLPEAQQLIQDRLSDGVLVHPAVSIRIPEYRPIFVTGDVRKPGSYPYRFGGSVKAAIAAAGGEGHPTELLPSVAMSDFVMAEERVRQLEMNRLALRVRKARLEAQKDESQSFAMPQLVGFNSDAIDLRLVFSSENDAFLTLQKTYQDQLEVIQKQRPLIEAEIKAVTDQIATEEDRLRLVNGRLADLETIFGKGLLRKEVLTNQRIEKALVQAELSRLEGQIATLRRTMGELDVKIEEVKANYNRQTLSELQETSQRLREIEAIIGMARKLRNIKAEYVNIRSDEPDYTILISRSSGSGTVTFNATRETILEPGDVIEFKLKSRREPGGLSFPTTRAAMPTSSKLTADSSLAESSATSSR
jgi:polysaccharide biosynthesis/export protein